MAVKALRVIATGNVVPSNPPLMPLLSAIVDSGIEQPTRKIMLLDGTRKTDEEAYKRIKGMVMVQIFSRLVLRICKHYKFEGMPTHSITALKEHGLQTKSSSSLRHIRVFLPAKVQNIAA
jgi:hypothetical protein